MNYDKIKRIPKTIQEDIEEENLTPKEISELIDEYGEDIILGEDLVQKK